MARYSPRQIGGMVVTALGLAIASSGLIWNPWIAGLWKGDKVVDYREVLLQYAVTSIATGLVIAALGLAFGRKKHRWLDRITLVAIVLGSSLVLDRFLLVQLNLPWWRFDPEVHYVHREGAVRLLGPGKFIRINSLGFHDDEFPRHKPKGEFRGLMLGDSVTMGYGLTLEETFSNRLEQMLRSETGPYDSYQIINAGVHGYSTAQELVILKRSLDLGPDFVAVGFCMNDVPEPFLVDADFGGTGVDYHGVTQSKSRLLGYLSNETGIGRLVQSLASRGKQLEWEKRAELFSVREMATLPADAPKYEKAWDSILSSLDQIYQLAEQRGFRVVLLLFPFTFQLRDETRCRPQRILSEHAARHGVKAIDFTPTFAGLIYDDPELLAVMERRYTPEQIEAFYRWKIEEYFLDSDHFTAKGHEVIARALDEYLRETGW